MHAMARNLCAASMLLVLCGCAARESGSPVTVSNQGFRIAVVAGKEGVDAEITDLRGGRTVAKGPCIHEAVLAGTTRRLENPVVAAGENQIVIRGRLAGLDMEHTFSLPADRPIVEERITLSNASGETIALDDFEAGCTLPVADRENRVSAELAGDEFLAVPFLHRADDPPGRRHAFTMQEVVTQPATESYFGVRPLAPLRVVPSRHRYAESWAWTRGENLVVISKVCQEHLQFSVISTHRRDDGIRLRVGGAAMVIGEPADLTRIKPGQRIDLGLTRYQALEGGHREACYALRTLLDEQGCRFPEGFNPPVHWEQLYDMENAWTDRPALYTLAALEREAGKAQAFSCESLYLDPGWDTDFGTFLWGESWLGKQKAFIDDMRARHGLKVSMHFPLASWISEPKVFGPWGKEPYKSFPIEARMKPDGEILCLGSRAYLDTAEKRMLESCANGAVFLMFDGNWFVPCDNPDHGHPIPYRTEDHVRANLDLARRIHAKYPHVQIEMHDMIAGGNPLRMTPIYYKYGLPGSYDTNWGFELMWNPMEDLVQGRTTALYYANLGCNVPFYTHIDLRKDNEHCIVLWWYASTCRHLGIGGTHRDASIVKAQQEAMRWYRNNDRFFKHGEFYGVSEEIHVHVLPSEHACVVNAFNLGDKPKTVSGSIDLKEIGMDTAAAYVSRESIGTVENGRLRIRAELPPWGAKVGTVEISRKD